MESCCWGWAPHARHARVAQHAGSHSTHRTLDTARHTTARHGTPRHSTVRHGTLHIWTDSGNVGGSPSIGPLSPLPPLLRDHPLLSPWDHQPLVDDRVGNALALLSRATVMRDGMAATNNEVGPCRPVCGAHLHIVRFHYHSRDPNDGESWPFRSAYSLSAHLLELYCITVPIYVGTQGLRDEIVGLTTEQETMRIAAEAERTLLEAKLACLQDPESAAMVLSRASHAAPHPCTSA